MGLTGTVATVVFVTTERSLITTKAGDPFRLADRRQPSRMRSSFSRSRC